MKEVDLQKNEWQAKIEEYLDLTAPAYYNLYRLAHAIYGKYFLLVALNHKTRIAINH